MIRKKTLKTLEYDAVIRTLAAFASTAPGRALCESLLPFPSFEEAEAALNETDDALLCLLKYGELPLGGINAIGPAVRQAESGAVLECPDFLRLASFLRAVERLLDQVAEDKNSGDPLMIHEKLRSLEALPGFRRRLEQSIKDDQDLFDQASGKLQQIRQNLREAQASV